MPGASELGRLVEAALEPGRDQLIVDAADGGAGGSARIAIPDIAFKGASLDEVKAVTGHEIGHYVLGHVWLTVLLLEELLFYTHPSVERRVRRAMDWKASHPQ